MIVVSINYDQNIFISLVTYLTSPVVEALLQLNMHSNMNEARDARSTDLVFFLGFQGKKGLFISDRIVLRGITRVGCLERPSLFVCMFVGGSQHCFQPRLSTALNVHETNASPGGLRARKQNRQLFSKLFSP